VLIVALFFKAPNQFLQKKKKKKKQINFFKKKTTANQRAYDFSFFFPPSLKEMIVIISARLKKNIVHAFSASHLGGGWGIQVLSQKTENSIQKTFTGSPANKKIRGILL